MIRAISRTLVWLAVLGLVFAAAQPAAAQDMIQWKFATLAPKNVGWANQVREILLPWLSEKTDGRLSLKIYWGGIMGNDDDYVKKMHVGQIEGAGMTGKGANIACREFSVVGLPFLFNDYAEVDHVRERMFPEFEAFFASHGYKLVLWIDQDFDQFYSTKWKFESLAEFPKARIVTWYGPDEAAMLQALGANPIPVGVTEVGSAVRTGLADTNIAPAIWQVGSQLYSTSRYVNTMRIRYSPAVIVVTNDAWGQLTEAHQRALDESRAPVQRKFCEGTRAENERCLNAMLQYGLQQVDLTPEQLAPIKERAMTVYGGLAGKYYPPELLEQVRRVLRDYRKSRAN